jgi:hypothetical protein
MKDAVMPFAHRKVEAEGIHESAERTSCIQSPGQRPDVASRDQSRPRLVRPFFGALNSPH